MTDASGFLAAIRDRPDDDLRRLVYADWLDEHGDPARAEFVRVQCELCRLPPDHPDRPALAEREANLFLAHRDHWAVPRLRGKQRFRRGFVDAVEVSAESLLAAAGRVFAEPVRELRVVSADRFAAELAALPGLERVEVLDLSNNTFGAQGRLAQFLAAARLDRLRRLVLRNNQLFADDVPVLARSAVAGQLDHLDLSGNPIGDDGLTALAEAPTFGRLTTLVARGDEQPFYNCVHAAGAAALSRSRTLTGLRTLNLGGHHVGDAGLIELVRLPNAAGLTDLDVSNNDVGEIGEAGVEALIESPHLGALRKVSLAGGRNRVSRLAAEALAGWPRLRDGVRVDLRGCRIDEAGLAALRRSPWAEGFLFDG